MLSCLYVVMFVFGFGAKCCRVVAQKAVALSQQDSIYRATSGGYTLLISFVNQTL